jgi:DNA-binding MarR family transcriptional regulator
MNGNLMVSKGLYSTGLNTTEMMIISQIEEFERNGNECFVTNQQFADWFGVSTKTIERTLDKLEENNYIKRETKTVNTNGRKSKIRKIKTVEGTVKLTQAYDDLEGEGTVKMTVASDGRYRQIVQKEPSICPEGSVNLSGRYRQNDAIKEKIKEKEKEKIKITEEAELLPTGTASASPSPTGASSNFILAQAKAIELHTQNKYKKWKEIIEEIKSEFNVTFEVNDLRKFFNDEELQNQILIQSNKVRDQQKQDKALQRKLTYLDDLMSALDNRGVMATDDEVIAKCKEFYYSNRPDKYKWSCKDLIEIVNNSHSKINDTFDSVVKEFVEIRNNYV